MLFTVRGDVRRRSPVHQNTLFLACSCRVSTNIFAHAFCGGERKKQGHLGAVALDIDTVTVWMSDAFGGESSRSTTRFHGLAPAIAYLPEEYKEHFYYH